MDEHHWQLFSRKIPAEANERLTVVLESFCESGSDDLPRACFRWFARADRDPAGVQMGAFEARGVVLQGRRAFIDGHNAFFITKITVDAEPQDNRRRRRRLSDDRQQDLPFEQPTRGGDG
jgi:hypothetical protein